MEWSQSLYRSLKLLPRIKVGKKQSIDYAVV